MCFLIHRLFRILLLNFQVYLFLDIFLVIFNLFMTIRVLYILKNFKEMSDICKIGNNTLIAIQVSISSVQSLSCVWLLATLWPAARQASLSITNSQSLLKLMTIESVMPSNHLTLCHPSLLPPSIFPSIRLFSNESVFSHQVAKVLEFQLHRQSFQWIFRTDLL